MLPLFFLSIGVHSVWHFSWRVASSVFRCVSIQHGMLNVFIFIAASCVLLLMYSIQFSVFVCSTCVVVCTAFKGGVAVLVTSDGRDFFHLQTMWTIHCCFFRSLSHRFLSFDAVLYFVLVGGISRSILRRVDRTISHFQSQVFTCLKHRRRGYCSKQTECVANLI